MEAVQYVQPEDQYLCGIIRAYKQAVVGEEESVDQGQKFQAQTVPA